MLSSDEKVRVDLRPLTGWPDYILDYNSILTQLEWPLHLDTDLYKAQEMGVELYTYKQVISNNSSDHTKLDLNFIKTWF